MATTAVPARGRESRFRQLYDAHRARVLRYALSRPFSGEDAPQAMAETFATAWTHLDQVPDGEPSLPWFYASAGGVLANMRRRQRRRSELVERIREELRWLAALFGSGEPNEDTLVAWPG